ncbi:MAG: DUF1427 family protein, partial [Bosea sp. (in: a-proteobacteria)]
AHALQITRQIVAHLVEPPGLRWTPAPVEPPKNDPQELTGLVRIGEQPGVDGREIIARLVDGSRFQEFKQLHGETLVCGFARIEGFELGILAGEQIMPVAKRLIGGEGLSLGWIRSQCGEHIFGALPARSDEDGDREPGARLS